VVQASPAGTWTPSPRGKLHHAWDFEPRRRGPGLRQIGERLVESPEAAGLPERQDADQGNAGAEKQRLQGARERRGRQAADADISEE
jgi:hypothetical protein